MWHYYHDAMRFADRLDPQEWLLLLLGVLAMGAFCMRGFVTRSRY